MTIGRYNIDLYGGPHDGERFVMELEEDHPMPDYFCVASCVNGYQYYRAPISMPLNPEDFVRYHWAKSGPPSSDCSVKHVRVG